MDELKKIIRTELDPEVLEQKKEAKQKRGFATTGTKILNYIFENTVEVYEIDTGAEYLMEYLQLFDIIGVMGFIPKEIDHGSSKLLNGYYIVVDFDNRDVMVYEPVVKHQPIGQFLREAKAELSDPGPELSHSQEQFSKWFNRSK